MKKHDFRKFCKRFMGGGMALSLALTLLPAVPASAANRPGTSRPLSEAARSKPNLTKAGSVPVSADTLTYDQPFEPFTAGCENFRIPALITLQNGDLLATGDARWEEWNDGGGIDSIASVSSDNGKTWNYSFPIYFPDTYGYVGQGGNGENSNSTTVIDPGVVEGPDGTIYFIADVNPTGSTTMYKSIGTGTGYVTVDGERYLALTQDFNTSYNTEPKDNDLTTYPYYIEHFNDEGYARILQRADNAETGYGVDEWYNLYTVTDNGEYIADLKQKQVNSDTDIQQNVFFKGSKFHVYSIDYLWVVESKDHGRTWEHPRDLTDQIKRKDNEHALLVSPGKGITTSQGDIAIGFYDYGDGHQDSSMVYSTDNGETWKRTEDVKKQSGDSSENEIVELEDGTLRMFYRNNNGSMSYADLVKNESTGEYTMGSEVKESSVSVNSNCNLSVLSYSQKIDGKQLLFVSCPTSGRAAGKIFAFLVDDTQENNPLILYHSFTVPGGESGFVYSCLTELEDGRIGMLWEPNHSTMYFDVFGIYDLLPDSAELTEASIYLELEKGEEYKRIYGEGTPDITLTPEGSVAEAVAGTEVQTYILRDHIAERDKNLNSFSETVNKNITLESAEFTFTSGEGENQWAVYNESAKKYLTNQSDVNTFFSDAKLNNMTFTPKTVNGETVFEISKDTSRYIIFFYTEMNFNSIGNNNTSDTWNLNFTLLEKKESVEENDLVPGYQKVSEIQDGHSYLIVSVWENNVFALYPINGKNDQTKLIGASDQAETLERKKVSIRAAGAGKTKTVIDGVTYHITAKDSVVVLNPGDTYDIPSLSASVPNPENSTVTAEAFLDVEEGLFDHKGAENSVAFSTDSFSGSKNTAINFEGAEFTFTGSGETWAIKHGDRYLMNKVNWPDTFFTETETNMKVVKNAGADTFKICRADFIRDVFDVDIKDRFNNLMGYLVFYNRGMEFRSYGTGVKDGSTHGNNPYGQHANYWITLLEKQDGTSDEDVIAGYKAVSSITSGKQYLISSVLEDGSVAVLFPDNGVTAQTKLAKRVKKGVRITAGSDAGASSITVDGKKYKFEVAVCSSDHTQEANLETQNAVAADCLEEGYSGDKVCKACKKVIETGEAVSALGHDWNETGTKTAVSETEDGKTVFTCKRDTTHTKKDIFAHSVIYRNFMAQYNHAKSILDSKEIYEPDSIAALQAVYNSAKELVDGKDETFLTNRAMIPAAASLQTAAENAASTRRALEEALQEEINASKKIYDSGEKPYYQTASWNAFKAAFETAIAVTEDTVYAVLKSAEENLHEKSVVIMKLKYRTELQELYEEQKDKTQGSYLSETWTVFTEARDAAKAVLDKQDAQVEELFGAKSGLSLAVRGLRTPTEALAPTVSFTAPKTGQRPKAAKVTGSSKDEAHQTAILDHAQNPVTFSKADASSSLDIQRLDGVWGFNDQILSGAYDDKFDVFGEDPIVISFKLYLKKRPESDLGLITKGDFQYAVQLTQNGLNFFMRNSSNGWPTEFFSITDNKLNKWLDVFAVIDGKEKMRLFVDGEAGSTSTSGAASTTHTDAAFAIGCRDMGNTKDQKFTSDYGYLADVKFYSGKEMTDAMKTAINLQTLGEDAHTVIKGLVDTINPTANITASPYHAQTAWSKSDGSALSVTEQFEENTVYCAQTVFTALGDYEFLDSGEFIGGVVKSVSTGLDESEDVEASVEVSKDKKTMTVEVTYPACPCIISEIGLEDEELVIPENQTSADLTFQPTVTLNKNGCDVSGHPNAFGSDVTYSYVVTDPGKTGATITDGGVVTVTASGRAKITVTACLANGARKSKTVQIDVKKEGLTYYTVTFYKNDGTEETVDIQEIEENGNAMEPDEPSRSGYTFNGWYKDPDCTDGEEFDFDSDLITENTDLYAKWTEENSSTDIPLTSIHLDPSEITLKAKGEQKKINPSFAPENASNKKLIWKTSDPAVATVEQDGTVTAVETGGAVITAVSQADSRIKETADVTVEIDGSSETIPVTDIKLNQISKTLTGIGKTVQLSVKSIQPENASDKTVIWTSKDDTVATVDRETGLVTAVGKGTTTITATAAGGKDVSANVKITVLIDAKPVSGISVEPKEIELTKAGETGKLKAVVLPEEANQDVTWSSSDETIATVDLDGTVTAVADGIAIITAVSDEDASKTATAKVTVKIASEGKPVTYTVTFFANGGAGAPKAISVLEGSSISKPAVKPQWKGHTFAGWYQDSKGNKAYQFGSPVYADLKLYAKWTLNKYKVTFQTNGGSAVQYQKIEYNKTVSKPTDPKREGYKFIGWFADPAFKAPFDFAKTKIEKDTVLYAKWDKESALEQGKTYSVKGFDYIVTDISGKKAAIKAGINKKAKKVKIPATVTINGEKCTVAAINKNAFKGYKKLTSVTIEANIKTIDKNAFKGCSKLKTITFKGKKLPKIKGGAFKNIAKTVTVKAPKLSKKQKKQLPKTLKKAGIKKVKVK